MGNAIWSAEEINKDVTYAYYTVPGSNANEIRDSLNKFGPFDLDGVRHDALTRWIVNWGWPGFGTNKGELNKSEITLKIIVIVPRLEDESKLKPELKLRWNKYISKLIEHENGHIKIARDCQKEIRESVMRSKPLIANDLASGIVKKYIELEKAFDLKSDHGINDGATFP